MRNIFVLFAILTSTFIRAQVVSNPSENVSNVVRNSNWCYITTSPPTWDLAVNANQCRNAYNYVTGELWLWESTKLGNGAWVLKGMVTRISGTGSPAYTPTNPSEIAINADGKVFAWNGSVWVSTNDEATTVTNTATISNSGTLPNLILIVNDGSISSAKITDGTVELPDLSIPLQDIITKLNWRLLGNTGTDPSINFLGTTDNTDMSVRTNNTERIRIKNTGNVGIGTSTSLSEKLTVNGNIETRGTSPYILFGGTTNSIMQGCVSSNAAAVGNYTVIATAPTHGISLVSGGQMGVVVNPTTANVSIRTPNAFNTLQIGAPYVLGTTGIRLGVSSIPVLGVNASGDIVPATGSLVPTPTAANQIPISSSSAGFPYVNRSVSDILATIPVYAASTSSTAQANAIAGGLVVGNSFWWDDNIAGTPDVLVKIR